MEERVTHRWSDQRDKLLAALLAAQKSAPNAVKAKVNTHLKSKYADLEAVRLATVPHLFAQGIMVVQIPAGTTADGRVVVGTQLIHAESGQFLNVEMELPCAKADPQAVGAAITYARKYTLVSLLCIATEDDDGHAATERREEKRSGPAMTATFTKARKAVDKEQTYEGLQRLRTFVENHKELTDDEKCHLLGLIDQKRAPLKKE